MEVTVYGQLRSATGSKTVEIDSDAETVGDALEQFLDAYPGARRHVLDDDGTVRSSVRLVCDGERVALDDACPPKATLQLFPAMEGGAGVPSPADSE